MRGSLFLEEVSVPPVQGGSRAQYVTVALERTIAGLNGELTYALPQNGSRETGWLIGQPVVVPLRTGRVVGYVTGFESQIDFDLTQLRPIETRLSAEPLFDEFALKIARWMSAYYHCPLPECLACFVPVGATPTLEGRYVFVAPEPLRALRDLSRARPNCLRSLMRCGKPRNRLPRAKLAS